MHPKPVKDVETFDGRTHEVDIRHVERTYTAWAFIDKQMIQGADAASQLKALSNWKKTYQAAFTTERRSASADS